MGEILELPPKTIQCFADGITEVIASIHAIPNEIIKCHFANTSLFHIGTLEKFMCIV